MNACQRIEQHANFSCPDEELQEALTWIAKDVCLAPDGKWYPEYELDRLGKDQQRAICEHAKAGRLTYFDQADGIPEMEGIRISINPRPQLLEWWLAQSNADVPLKERVLAVLTPNQRNIIEYLWDRKTASYETLRTIPNAWRDVPAFDAITKQLKAIDGRLEKHGLGVVDLVISTSSPARVNLERPDT